MPRVWSCSPECKGNLKWPHVPAPALDACAEGDELEKGSGNRCHPPFSRVLAGSLEQGEDQVPTASLSQGHHRPACPHPPAHLRSSSAEVTIVQRGCPVLFQLVTRDQFLGHSVGSTSVSAWPEAQIPSLHTSFPTTSLPQAQLLRIVVFPHFPKVNSS